MLLAALSPLQLIFPGLVLLIAGFLLRRGAVRARQSHQRDVAAEVRRDFAAAERGGTARVQQLEVRLYEYGREVEGRIETQLTVLDELIRQADDEIERLETLLAESRAAGAKSGEATPPDTVSMRAPLTAQQRRMVCFLAMAGYRAEEIAHLVERPVGQIRQVLADDSRGASAA